MQKSVEVGFVVHWVVLLTIEAVVVALLEALTEAEAVIVPVGPTVVELALMEKLFDAETVELAVLADADPEAVGPTVVELTLPEKLYEAELEVDDEPVAIGPTGELLLTETDGTPDEYGGTEE